MNKIPHSLGLLTSFMLVAFLASGCSQQKAKKELHKKVFKGSPTMKSILQNRHRNPTGQQQQEYRQAPDWSTKSNRPAYRTAVHIPTGDTNYKAFTRDQHNELNGIFPRLPNPDLCMYVFPHLSSERATIPGYSSCFAMYDNNHYALPGEMSAIWQDR